MGDSSQKKTLIDFLYRDLSNPLSDIKTSADDFANIIKSIFNDAEENYRITPILIYRQVTY